jgi:hypothetical protein
MRVGCPVMCFLLVAVLSGAQALAGAAPEESADLLLVGGHVRLAQGQGRAQGRHHRRR